MMFDRTGLVTAPHVDVAVDRVGLDQPSMIKATDHIHGGRHPDRVSAPPRTSCTIPIRSDARPANAPIPLDSMSDRSSPTLHRYTVTPPMISSPTTVIDSQRTRRTPP